MSAAGVHEAASAAAGYFDHVRPELLELVPAEARRVLDVGCGRGGLGAAIMERQQAEVWGLELVPEAAAVAEQRLDRVLREDLDALEGLPVAEGHFDAMVFGDVLEHLRDPHRLLAVLKRHLAPDGRIVCSIPNVKHWSVVVPLLLHDRFRYEDAGLLDRTHVHLFTLHEIDEMLQDVGFAVTHLGATTHAMPAEFRPFAEIVGRFGGDVTETAGRLDVYQYLIVARPTAARTPPATT